MSLKLTPDLLLLILNQVKWQMSFWNHEYGDLKTDVWLILILFSFHAAMLTCLLWVCYYTSWHVCGPCRLIVVPEHTLPV
uniref:Uncharacterized protein n=1 Tax=Octopus bimaculoides TaxID=37653 RepID=A0A0L8GZ37_OCTBM